MMTDEDQNRVASTVRDLGPDGMRRILAWGATVAGLLLATGAVLGWIAHGLLVGH